MLAPMVWGQHRRAVDCRLVRQRRRVVFLGSPVALLLENLVCNQQSELERDGPLKRIAAGPPAVAITTTSAIHNDIVSDIAHRSCDPFGALFI